MPLPSSSNGAARDAREKRFSVRWDRRGPPRPAALLCPPRPGPAPTPPGQPNAGGDRLPGRPRGGRRRSLPAPPSPPPRRAGPRGARLRAPGSVRRGLLPAPQVTCGTLRPAAAPRNKFPGRPPPLRRRALTSAMFAARKGRRGPGRGGVTSPPRRRRKRRRRVAGCAAAGSGGRAGRGRGRAARRALRHRARAAEGRGRGRRGESHARALSLSITAQVPPPSSRPRPLGPSCQRRALTAAERCGGAVRKGARSFRSAEPLGAAHGAQTVRVSLRIEQIALPPALLTLGRERRRPTAVLGSSAVRDAAVVLPT